MRDIETSGNYGVLGGGIANEAPTSERSIASALSGLQEGNARLRGLEERFSQIAIRLGGFEPKVGGATGPASHEVSAGERPLVDEVLNVARDEHELISRIEQLGRRIHEALGV